MIFNTRKQKTQRPENAGTSVDISVRKMILLVLYITSVLYLPLIAEWIEIPQTLPQPRIETVTKHSVSFEQRKLTTFASTEFQKTEVYPNQTIQSSSSFSKRTDLPVQDDIEHDEKNVGIGNYIEDVQSKLLKRNRKTFKNKIEILLELKRNLLYNIKEKIANLWSPTSQNRQARQHEKEDDYHMDFPSNEGALMTIGFLTFAVFLIKLVLKLIIALKDHKNAAMTTTTVAPAAILLGRRKRDIYEDDIRILGYINDFKFQ